MQTLRVSQVRHGSFSEGPRSNTTVWLAGCSIRCPGCFNPELWDSEAGKEVEGEALLESISVGIASGDNGLALVGGEPFDQVASLTALLVAFNGIFPEVPVTLYSGYCVEELREQQACRRVLDLANVLVDGRFLIEQSDQDLGYRGSANQRVIDLVRSSVSRYTDLQLLAWDKLIAFLPDGSLAGAEPLLTMLSGEESEECGYHTQRGEP